MNVLAIVSKDGVTPPETISLFRDGGFTIESKPPWKTKKRWDLKSRVFVFEGRTRLLIGDTLWRHQNHAPLALSNENLARLVAYDTGSFYQTSNDVTVALYRLKGYGYPIVTWWSNETGRRIA